MLGKKGDFWHLGGHGRLNQPMVRLSHGISVRLSVRLSSVTRVDQSKKRCKLRSPNLYRRLPGRL